MSVNGWRWLTAFFSDPQRLSDQSYRNEGEQTFFFGEQTANTNKFAVSGRRTSIKLSLFFHLFSHWAMGVRKNENPIRESPRKWGVSLIGV